MGFQPTLGLSYLPAVSTLPCPKSIEKNVFTVMRQFLATFLQLFKDMDFIWFLLHIINLVFAAYYYYYMCRPSFI